MKRFLSSRGDPSTPLRTGPQQRLCLTFGRGEEVKYITHLDVMRLWHRALRRAGMPLLYSEGFNPRPRIAIAAPLALGVTSEAELMDVFLERKVSLHFFTRVVSEQLPQGIEILEVREYWPKLPSLQSQLRFAEYRVEVESRKSPEEVSHALRSLLATRSLPWQHARDKETRRYDLRALIGALWLVDQGSGVRSQGSAPTPHPRQLNDARYTLGMRLRHDAGGSGRPEQVTAALGFSEFPKSIHRVRLILASR